MQPLGNVENWLSEVEIKMRQSIHWQVISTIFDQVNFFLGIISKILSSNKPFEVCLCVV